MARIGTHCGVAVAALLALGWPTSPVHAAEKDAGLRERILALNDITGSEPLEGKIRILMADPASTKKLLAEAKLVAKQKDAPLSYTADFILARAAHELKDFDGARTFYERSFKQAAQLQSVEKVSQVLFGLIALYYENQKYEECSQVCADFISLSAKDDSSLERKKVPVAEIMIQAIAKQGKYDEALKLLDKLFKPGTDHWEVLSLRGFVQREAGRYDEAAKTYEDAIDRIQKDETLKDDEKRSESDRRRYILSSIYVDQNRVEKAIEVLRTLLKHKPDSSTYNNDLGYILADHDRDLPEAEKLIRKAIDLDRKERKADPDLAPDENRDNPAYLDSLGWVLFKQKKYEEAKRYLVEAAKDKDAQDIEIYDHLGDVYKALGENPEALGTWKKAVRLAKSNKRDQQKKAEVEKKIKNLDDKSK